MLICFLLFTFCQLNRLGKYAIGQFINFLFSRCSVELLWLGFQMRSFGKPDTFSQNRSRNSSPFLCTFIRIIKILRKSYAYRVAHERSFLLPFIPFSLLLLCQNYRLVHIQDFLQSIRMNIFTFRPTTCN